MERLFRYSVEHTRQIRLIWMDDTRSDRAIKGSGGRIECIVVICSLRLINLSTEASRFALIAQLLNPKVGLLACAGNVDSNLVVSLPTHIVYAAIKFDAGIIRNRMRLGSHHRHLNTLAQRCVIKLALGATHSCEERKHKDNVLSHSRQSRLIIRRIILSRNVVRKVTPK